MSIASSAVLVLSITSGLCTYSSCAWLKAQHSWKGCSLGKDPHWLHHSWNQAHHEQSAPQLCESTERLSSHGSYSLRDSYVSCASHCASLSSRAACCKKSELVLKRQFGDIFCKIVQQIHLGLGYFLTDKCWSYTPLSIAKYGQRNHQSHQSTHHWQQACQYSADTFLAATFHVLCLIFNNYSQAP